MKMRKSLLSAMGIAVLAMASCGENNNSKQTPEGSMATKNSNITPDKPETASDTIRIEIHANDRMEYDKNILRVKAGQTVILTLKHVGKMPETAMGHNWVLLQKGVDKPSFAEAAVNAKDNNYIPIDHDYQIIANTEMLGGGESSTIIFKAPEKNIYDFICSFPGHYVKMKGKFVVE